MNRPALGSFPPAKFAEWLETGLMTVAPKGLDQLMTTLCGSSANGKFVWPLKRRSPTSCGGEQQRIPKSGTDRQKTRSKRPLWLTERENEAMPNLQKKKWVSLPSISHRHHQHLPVRD